MRREETTVKDNYCWTEVCVEKEEIPTWKGVREIQGKGMYIYTFTDEYNHRKRPTFHQLRLIITKPFIENDHKIYNALIKWAQMISRFYQPPTVIAISNHGENEFLEMKICITKGNSGTTNDHFQANFDHVFIFSSSKEYFSLHTQVLVLFKDDIVLLYFHSWTATATWIPSAYVSINTAQIIAWCTYVPTT